MPAPDPRSPSLETTDERAHVLRARAGDTRALRELLHHYAPGLYRVAHALTRDVRAAVLLCSAACDRARDEIATLPEGEPFFVWMVRLIAESAPAFGGLELPPGAVDARMRRALDRLTLHEQLVLALRVVEGMPYPRIANVFRATSSATLQLMSSARVHLLEQLARAERAT